MRRPRRSSLSSFNGINLTPLLDLTFLLLITFIITFPLMESGIAVVLPRAKAPPVDQTENKPVQITVDKDGRHYWGTDPVAPEILQERLKQAFAANPELSLILRGDTDANYGKVVEVAAIAKKIGVKHLSLATQEQ